MNIRKLLTRLVSLVLIAVFLPTVAMADTWYLEDGSITVSATDSGQSVSQGGVTKEDSAPVIRNRDSSASTTNNVTIRADTGATANVTLEDTNIDTTGGAYYAKLLEAKGITYLGSFHNGFRQLTNNKRPVTSPEDLKGLNIRVPGSEIYMGFFKAFGAVPSSTNWSEVFTNLQQGVIDGQENGVSITATSGMTEVQDYMTIWNYTYENDLFLVNRNIWDSLNEATQQLLSEKALEACNWGRDQLEAEEGDLIEEFRAEGTFSL